MQNTLVFATCHLYHRHHQSIMSQLDGFGYIIVSLHSAWFNAFFSINLHSLHHCLSSLTKFSSVFLFFLVFIWTSTLLSITVCYVSYLHGILMHTVQQNREENHLKWYFLIYLKFGVIHRLFFIPSFLLFSLIHLRILVLATL